MMISNFIHTALFAFYCLTRIVLAVDYGNIQYPGQIDYQWKGNPIYYPFNYNFQYPLLYSDSRYPDGSYSYSFETPDGIKRTEESSVNTGKNENVVRGSYSYIGPDNVRYTVNYVADKNGFRAYGDHLPQQITQQRPNKLVHRKHPEPHYYTGQPFNYYQRNPYFGYKK